MGSNNVLPSREFGMAMGFILGRFCLKMQDLHYGYWTDDLPVDVQNLPKAQAQYTELLISTIPHGVRRILDVGCGTGHTAKKLLDRGYQVDCVSPNPHLNQVAREKLGEQSRIFECRYQHLETDQKYDLILFSESFLFIHPAEVGIRKSASILNEGGYMLIMDVFKMTPDGQSPIGGGQHLHVFEETFSHSPFHKKVEKDITVNIAPTFDVLEAAYQECVQPAFNLFRTQLRANFPLLTRFLLWKFRSRVQKLEEKHFSRNRNGANFAKHKSYRLFLFQKKPDLLP